MSKLGNDSQPVVPYAALDESGAAFLMGSRCEACGSTHLGTVENCPKCAARGKTRPVRLSDRGTLYNYTVIHRSLPGVKVPFISATVDLDGGGTVRGNLLDVEPDPSQISFGMPVRVIFQSAATAVEGADGYFAHFFVPAEKAVS